MPAPLYLHHRTVPQQQASLAHTLAHKRQPLARGVWVFVYGLLAYKPPFRYISCKPQTLPGWQRRFNLRDSANRGTPTQPGLTLGLGQGGQCQGMSYLISGAESPQALTNIWQQEMLLPFYTPTWMNLGTEEHLVMLPDPASPAICHIPDDETARIIAQAHGPAGSNAGYLSHVRQGFARAGITDPYLEHLAGLPTS